MKTFSAVVDLLTLLILIGVFIFANVTGWTLAHIGFMVFIAALNAVSNSMSLDSIKEKLGIRD